MKRNHIAQFSTEGANEKKYMFHTYILRSQHSITYTSHRSIRSNPNNNCSCSASYNNSALRNSNSRKHTSLKGGNKLWISAMNMNVIKSNCSKSFQAQELPGTQKIYCCVYKSLKCCCFTIFQNSTMNHAKTRKKSNLLAFIHNIYGPF